MTAKSAAPAIHADDVLRCGDHPRFGPGPRDHLSVGCGRFLTEDVDSALAYRCVQCRTALCEPCIRQHFGWPEAGGGPMPHALDAAMAALTATPTGEAEGLPEALDKALASLARNELHYEYDYPDDPVLFVPYERIRAALAARSKREEAGG